MMVTTSGGVAPVYRMLVRHNVIRFRHCGLTGRRNGSNPADDGDYLR
jgi:hypothetical protein